MPRQKRAYSYIRFSREHQAAGDSLRRQEEATLAYCQRQGLVFDDSLNLRDLGVSAFKGRNAESGALGRFLEACKAGHIAQGSALVVESLDRISRQSPRRTVRLLTEILDEHRVEIHLTMLGKVFLPDKDDGVDLIIAVAMAMRANEESEVKSQRLQAAWARNRELAQKEGKLLRASLPWWLVLQNGKIISPQERAAAVIRIYELVADGISSGKIARLFNREKIPTWRPKAKLWDSSRIRDLIRNEGPSGTLTPTRKTAVAGRNYRIVGYYPQIISEELVAEARAVMIRNGRGNRGRLAQEGSWNNLLRGLLRYKGRWMRHTNHQNGTVDPKTGKKTFNSYYECLNSDIDNGGFVCISANQLEPLVIHGLLELQPADFLPLPKVNSAPRSSILKRKITDLEAKITHLVVAVENGSVSLAKRLLELEKELFEARNELLTAEAEEAAPSRDTFWHLKQVAPNLKDSEARERTAAALRRLLLRIDVGLTIEDIPRSDRLRGGIAKAVLLQQGRTIPDPVPAGGRRKPLYVLLSFIGGAKRLIYRDRLTNAKDEIGTIRVDGLGKEMD